MSDYVELSSLTKTYPTRTGGTAIIVKDFNLRIRRGEFVSLIGHSGCGKSTVLSMLAGLTDICGGGIILAGKELSGPGPDRGVVFQSPCLLPWMTAYENVKLGVDQVLTNASAAERRSLVEHYLSVVGLGDAMHRRPAELSQGMRQRVGIARAFALRPKMLLLDEPFGMLDSLTRCELQEVLLELWRENSITALMVTHDIDEALFLSDRVVCMTNGPEAEVGEIVHVPFPRPRQREAVLEHSDYYPLREGLITFLEERAHRRGAAKISEDSSFNNHAGGSVAVGELALATSVEQRAASTSSSQRGSLQMLVGELLAEQSALTVVDRFSRRHENGSLRPGEAYYRDLIPLTEPRKGEQYRFAVDLDKCSGCKACVCACHSLNGLDEGEMWRSVGLLVGTGLEARPSAPACSPQIPVSAFQQHITTSCHHCVEPACAHGCPVLAYEKDPTTGIVRHLDDQCIGCQYCVMTCPYDAPKFSKSKGIVRKCDMCHERLSQGEAPACVQACPHGAIRIEVVEKDKVRNEAAPRLASLLPGTFPSSFTLPTTRYESKRLPVLLGRPSDENALRLEDAHVPLVVMLVLTQMAAGLHVVHATLFMLGIREYLPALAIAATAVLISGLLASVAHLGRPLKAWRAFLGWRRSWMSREIIAFSIYAALAAVSLQAAPRGWVSVTTALVALASVACSAMIYVSTHRPFWNATLVFGKFGGTTLLLGSATATIWAAWVAPRLASSFLIATMIVRTLLFVFETTVMLCGRRNPELPQHRSALIAFALLKDMLLSRVVLFVAATLFSIMALGNILRLGFAWTLLSWMATVASQFAERRMFFTTCPAPRMPGSVAA